ncbi:MAG TPA: glycosyltransferase, partial [Xanthobacteraceae bacterium]
MRVLSIHNRYQFPGGEDAIFEAEAAGLARCGHTVRRLEFDNRDLGERVAPAAAVKAAANTVWSRSGADRVRAAIREFRPDIAHFHNTFPLVSPAAFSACHDENVPVVHTLHNYRLLCPSATLFRDGKPCEDCVGKFLPWSGVLHACYRQSRTQTAAAAAMLAVHRVRKTWWNDVDLFIALTEFSRAKFIEGGLPGGRIAVKPNFVDVEPPARPQPRNGFLFVGRLVEEKGIRALLAAWTEVVGASLRIAGGGPLEELVRGFAALRAGVTYLGAIDRDSVLNEMSCASALVFPSTWYEAFPVAIVEAFACGLPVIAPRRGSMAEIVRHGETGLLYEPDEHAALASAIEWAAEHGSDLLTMGANCRRAHEQTYSSST